MFRVPFVLVFENEEFFYNGDKWVKCPHYDGFVYKQLEYNCVRIKDGYKTNLNATDMITIK